MNLTFYCSDDVCLERHRIEPFAASLEVACQACGRAHALTCSAVMQSENMVDACASCGTESLYIQKDFNQGLGCVILLVGAGLSFWTYGISVVVFALVDLVLYYKLPDVTICYSCFSEYRQVRRNPAHAIYNLAMAQKVLREKP